MNDVLCVTGIARFGVQVDDVHVVRNSSSEGTWGNAVDPEGL